MHIELTNFEIYLFFIIWFIGILEFSHRVAQLIVKIEKFIFKLFHYLKLRRK